MCCSCSRTVGLVLGEALECSVSTGGSFCAEWQLWASSEVFTPTKCSSTKGEEWQQSQAPCVALKPHPRAVLVSCPSLLLLRSNQP